MLIAVFITEMVILHKYVYLLLLLLLRLKCYAIYWDNIMSLIGDETALIIAR